VFVHHFDTVDGLTPICSESHLLVRFFSTKTSLILFTSSIIASFDCKNNDYFSFSLLFGNKFIIPRYIFPLFLLLIYYLGWDIVNETYQKAGFLICLINNIPTRVVDGDLVKIMAWYDNEWGFTNQMIRQIQSLFANN
jgi:hypothetical protein